VIAEWGSCPGCGVQAVGGERGGPVVGDGCRSAVKADPPERQDCRRGRLQKQSGEQLIIN